ncbi:MAG: methyltransferase domain-containing protein [Nitrospiraceae bacterium]|nr:methyltransferase domain-containing protein [Nitrospiraceae bacterium]
MTFDWDASKYSKLAALQAEAGERLINALCIQNHDSILDIGCGVGNLTLKLAALVEEGFVLGIDASPPMIEKAKELAGQSNQRNIEFQVMSMAQTNFQGRFDVVFSNSALHWVKDISTALNAIRRALKPQGRIGVQFPLLTSEHPLVAITRKTIEELGYQSEYSNWKFPWFVPASAGEFADMLQTSGFKGIDVQSDETRCRFQTAASAMDFFDTVGILYSSPLSAEQKSTFKPKCLEILTGMTDHDGGMELLFPRLFAFAST